MSFAVAGITKLRDEFCSWDWTFGKTPKFTVTRQLELASVQGEVHELTLTLDIENGIVQEIKMSLPTSIKLETFREDASVVTSLRGVRYSEEIIAQVAKAIGCKKIRQLPQPVDMSNLAASQ